MRLRFCVWPFSLLSFFLISNRPHLLPSHIHVCMHYGFGRYYIACSHSTCYMLHAPCSESKYRGPALWYYSIARKSFDNHARTLLCKSNEKKRPRSGLIPFGLNWPRVRTSAPSEDRLLALDGLQPFDDDFPFVLLHVACSGVAQVAFEVVAFIEDLGRLATTC